MHYTRLLIFVAILTRFIPGAYGQIIKKENGYSISYANDSIAARYDSNILAMFLPASVMLDTDYSTRNRIFETLKEHQKQRKDTITLSISKEILKDDSGCIYQVSKDGQILSNWKSIGDFNTYTLQKSWHELLHGDVNGHKYIIDIKDRNGKDFIHIEQANNYPTIYLWGIYTKSEQPAVRQLLNKLVKIDSNNILLFPHVDWIKYKAKGTFDSFRFNNQLYLIPTSISLPSTHNDLLFLMGTIPDSAAYEYRIVNENEDNDIFSTWKPDAWTNNGNGNSLIEIKNINPGSYSIWIRQTFKFNSTDTARLRFPSMMGNEMIYYFTIRPQWYQTTWFNLIAGLLSGALLVLAIFIVYRDRQRSRQKQKDLLHKMDMLQLQSYRAQLNPHFVFNALSSIQSLINKNNPERANKYLTDFSSLLRVTLDQHKAEFWTLQDEIDLLNKYISLEQLRFAFRYVLYIDDGLRTIDTSFPSMLLQPIVENAIKHGISALGAEGNLTIAINASGKDLTIDIKDNGAGFNIAVTATGAHGINLTKQRIIFLNELNKEQRTKLDIRSTDTGTTARFYLYDHL